MFKSSWCTLFYTAVLRIRDVLVRIQIRGSVPLTNGSGSPIRTYPTPDLTPFFSAFKDEKK
jgi:hypothetical protein